MAKWTVSLVVVACMVGKPVLGQTPEEATGLAAAAGLEAGSQKALLGLGYVFPSAASAPGAYGAYFKTRVVLFNPNSHSIDILTQAMTPSGGTAIKTITLDAYTSTRWDDFLWSVFGYRGGAGIGMIEATTSHPFVATAEVYTDSAGGRYSTPITGLFTDDDVIASGNGGVNVVPFLRVDSQNRANFGCANADSFPVTVRARFYGNDQAQNPVTYYLSVPASGWVQQSVPFNDSYLIGYFDRVAGGSQLGVYCYGVNVNNQSNDGTWVPAVYTPLGR